MAERTVFAEATPAAGSLWLGCRARDRPPGAVLGGVELYLLRMWADLDPHGACEDGTVIGWSARYWGVSSPAALQRDSNLLCGETDKQKLTFIPSGAAATLRMNNRMPSSMSSLLTRISRACP